LAFANSFDYTIHIKIRKLKESSSKKVDNPGERVLEIFGQFQEFVFRQDF
jgi:hypothetical protein